MQFIIVITRCTCFRRFIFENCKVTKWKWGV